MDTAAAAHWRGCMAQYHLSTHAQILNHSQVVAHTQLGERCWILLKLTFLYYWDFLKGIS